MAAVDLPAGWTEARFPVMASGAQVLLAGGAHLLRRAEDRLRVLEARWSRFLPASEVSRLNRAGGAWVQVSADTVRLVAAAVAGWRVTGGDFDPTILPALQRLTGETPGPAAARRSVGLPGAHVDVEGGRVRIAPGTAFDPGGIGKGLAADLVATELSAAGATSVLVNVGGDLRAVGPGPFPGGWGVRIETPAGDLLAAVDRGGVATSSPTARSGRGPHGPWHHCIDPGTGLPIADAPGSATVVAPDAWLAEVWTKRLLRRGTDALTELAAAGLAGLVAGPGGDVHATPSMAALLGQRCPDDTGAGPQADVRLPDQEVLA